MKILFTFIFSIFLSSAFAINYYVDPSSTSLEEKGTIEAPWKNFSMLYNQVAVLNAGDSLLLKRGELFFEPLDLKYSGTASSPIVVTGYGPSKSKPIFMYKVPSSEKVRVEQFAIRLLRSKHIKVIGVEVTDDHMDPADHSATALIKIAIAIQESDFISIQNCNFSLVGIGVNIVGNNNLVDSCEIKNLRMVRNTEAAEDDDYGANAVVIAGAGNQVSHNYFYDCWAKSFDYGFDGGAIEMAGSTCKNNVIFRNTAMHCNGFMEMGSTDSGTISNNIVRENLVLNCSDLLYINNDGPFAVTVFNLRFEENIFIQTFAQLTRPETMISMRKNSDDKKMIVLDRNVFWLPMKIDVARPGQFKDGIVEHTRNIYYLKGGQLNFNPHPSERKLSSNSQLFNAMPPELVPFKYLLRFWQLLF